MKIALITGASSGLGQEAVIQIAKLTRKLDEIWILARRSEKLTKLQSEIQKLTKDHYGNKAKFLKLRILPWNVAEEYGLDQLKYLLAQCNPDLKLLINAAGYGKAGDFSTISYDDNLGMIDVNCRGLTAVTYLCLPYMKAGSRILQFASMAGFLPQTGFAVYAATKAYVISFSRALNIELAARRITVTAVCPGPVETEFFQVAGNYENDYKDSGSYKKLFMVQKEGVISRALKDAKAGKEVSIYGLPMNLLRLGAKLGPHKWIAVGQRWLNQYS